MEYQYKYHSPVGILTVMSDGEAITGLWIKKDSCNKDAKNIEVETEEIPIILKTKEWLDSYFAGENKNFTLPIKTEGTKFRQSVWKKLLDIPYGKVITYGDIAKMMAKETRKEKMSSQAIGGAVGSNPISILIPCHRVIGAGGNLTGYGGGIDVKVKLLELEGIDMNRIKFKKDGGQEKK